MAFTVPHFNVKFNVWVVPHTPGAGDPVDFANYLGQLYVQNRPFLNAADAATLLGGPVVYVRVDRTTHNLMGSLVKSIWVLGDSFGADWPYTVTWWDYIHRGFPNEYIEMVAAQCDTFGNPPDPNR